MSSSLDSPVLSVIIPTYNRSAMVTACVRSLQASGVSGLQAVVVDDGSKDDTEEKVRALGDNVVYLRQENQGPAAARNLGFRQSAGRYVAFVDDDDEWLPGVAAKIVELLDRNPNVDAVFSDAQIRWPDKPPTLWFDFLRANLPAVPHREAADGFRVFERGPFFRRLVERNAIFISAHIMRRQAFESAGMFDLELRGAADWELWMRMASRLTFGCWGEPLAIYARHDDNMSADGDHMNKDFWQALRRCLAKCDDLAPADKELLRRRVRESLLHYAYDAYNSGRYGEARGRFQTLLRECGFEKRSALLWLLCLLPQSLTASLRKLKQGWAGSAAPAGAVAR